MSPLTKEAIQLFNQRLQEFKISEEDKSSCEQCLEAKSSENNNKFIVNLFDSRSSKRWTKKINDDKKTQINNNNNNIVDKEKQAKNELYMKLRKERDAECLKLVQASNFIKTIKKKQPKSLLEEVDAENILLEAGEKCKILVDQINAVEYSEVFYSNSGRTGTITLQNFSFCEKPLKNMDYDLKTKYQNFYVVSISNGTNIQLSKSATPDENGIVSFANVFKFTNVEANFAFKLKVHCLTLKKLKKNCFMRVKPKKLCPMSKIYYENVYTYELQESSVLKTSFKTIGELVLNKSYINKTSFYPQFTKLSSLHQQGIFSMSVDDVVIEAQRSGFLTVGKKVKRCMIWERKWCVLNDTKFDVYNYPQDEFFCKPIYSLNLEYCLFPIPVNPENCSRTRTFVLQSGRPSNATFDENIYYLQSKPHFVAEKYYFNADSSSDFLDWTDELNGILESLNDWQGLFFKSEN